MLLKDKNAIIYGAAGSIGCRVARCFAREGARVHLCGRHADTLQQVADVISDDRGQVSVDVCDALDANAVSGHMDSVEAQHGRVDISFNLIGVDDDQGTVLTRMSVEDFRRPLAIGVAAHFVTATEAARRMEAGKSGVILALTATPARLALPLVGGFGAYCSAMEGFYRTLAAETGPAGVRVCWLRSAGSPETFGPEVAADDRGEPAGLGDRAYLEELRQATLLKRLPYADEIAEAAALVASDRASAMTAAGVNVTCGQIAD